MRFVKPLDEELVRRLAAQHECIVTIEENVDRRRRRQRGQRVPGRSGRRARGPPHRHPGPLHRARFARGLPGHGGPRRRRTRARDHPDLARAARRPRGRDRRRPPGRRMTMDCPVKTPTTMDDVQGRSDSRQIPINKVGIKDIYHPVRVRDRSGGEQHTVANFNMYVALPHNFKGTHMSRFVEVLHAARARGVGRVVPPDAARGDATPRRDDRPHRDELPLLRDEEGAGVRRREPDELPGEPDRRGQRRPRGAVDPGRRARDQPVPVLEEDRRVRRAQPALAHHDQGAGARAHLDRGTDRRRRAGGLERGLRDPEAPRREVRHRARLRQPEVRRGHRARRGGAAERARNACAHTSSKPRTSSPSTTTRRTR